MKTPSLSVIAERMPPGSAEVSHRHSKAQQFFFVLSGELVLESDGVRHVVRAREGAHVAAGVVHQALNVSDAPTEFLVISEPPSHDDRENISN
ncbi:MAG: cupin domain-containing protein [Gemmatimonadaceae bacterium]